MKRFDRRWFWILAAGIAVLIFCFSAQPSEQSGEVSEGVTARLLSFLPQVREMPAAERENLIDTADFFVRKCAHFSIYAALGAAVTLAMSGHKIPLSRALLFALGICLLYAASDETHQLFVPGRSGQASDVLIDFCGSLTGGLLVAGILIRLSRRKRESEDNVSAVR